MSPNPCKALALLLGTAKVLLPGSVAYDAQLSSYFTPQANTVHPACFVTPQNALDVSATIKTLGEIADDDSIAIRAGGHMWFATSNSAPGGITIDLRGLDEFTLSDDKNSIAVGPGTTWDTIYSQLDLLGLSVDGGRVAGVGASGLTLGGGISHFGPRYGWTFDQVISFQVVLANGSIVEASATINRDLFWGLKGGSNNFGVVTRIRLRTFKQPDLLWTTLTLNLLSELPNQAKIYSDLMSAENYDVYSSYLTGWGYVPDQGLTVALNQLFYTGPFRGQAPAYYKRILDLPNISTPFSSTVVGNMSTIALNAVNLQPPRVSRYMTTTATFIATEAMILAAYKAFNSSLPLVQGVKGLSWGVNLEAVPPQLYRRGGVENNALGLNKETKGLVVFLISPAWSDAEDDEKIYAAARSLIADVETSAKRLGVYVPFIYINYAAPWQRVIESYGDESVNKLQAIRRQYDTKGFFTKKVQGGFKIPAF